MQGQLLELRLASPFLFCVVEYHIVENLLEILKAGVTESRLCLYFVSNSAIATSFPLVATLNAPWTITRLISFFELRRQHALLVLLLEPARFLRPILEAGALLIAVHIRAMTVNNRQSFGADAGGTRWLLYLGHLIYLRIRELDLFSSLSDWSVKKSRG